MRPLIGVPAYTGTNPLAGQDEPTAFLPDVYTQAVRRAGGRVALLPPGGDEEEAAYIGRNIDGLMLAGGPDLNPRLYGAKEIHPLTQPPDDEQDRWEMWLTTQALMQGLPILGICRGMQVLNVRMGGTLYQHLPDLVGHGHGDDGPGFGTHDVRLGTAGLVPAILSADDGTIRNFVSVPARHHQSVDRIGNGLRAVAFARDGTVEAVELITDYPSSEFVVGVQWHPERGTDPRLFDAFIAAASDG